MWVYRDYRVLATFRRTFATGSFCMDCITGMNFCRTVSSLQTDASSVMANRTVNRCK